MTEAITVYITTENLEEARRIAEAVVRDRLAACANILGEITSFYHWNDAVENSTETAVIFKTRKALFGALEQRIRELHSYDCPCIVAWEIADGHTPYLDWLAAETKP